MVRVTQFGVPPPVTLTLEFRGLLWEITHIQSNSFQLPKSAQGRRKDPKKYQDIKKAPKMRQKSKKSVKPAPP